MAYDAFISYSSKDKAVGDRVVKALEAAGVGCWVAPRDVPPGEEWAAAIIRGINACRVMIVVFSESSNASPQVLREVERAVNRLMPLLPFKVDAVAPTGSLEYFLSAAHWLDASQPPMEARLAELVRSTCDLLGKERCQPGTGLSSSPPHRGGRWEAVVVAAALIVVAAGAWAWHRGATHLPGGTPDTPKMSRVVSPDAPVLLPERLKGRPAAGLLSVAYGSTPPAAPEGAVHPRAQFGILARRKMRFDAGFLPLRDGDDLASETDEYVIAAKALTGGFLYIFQVDSVGKVDWLFPQNPASRFSTGANPLAAGAVARVPSAENKQVLSLDRTQGIEHVYFVFCAVPWPELERALARSYEPPPAAVASRGGGSGPPPELAAVQEPNGLGLRGGTLRAVGGQHDASTAPDVSALFPVDVPGAAGPTPAMAGETDVTAAGSFIVAERWFRHVAGE